MTSIVNNDEMPLSLNQGIKFKKYQDKKHKRLENVNSIEGFTSHLQLSDNGLTNESNKIIDSNSMLTSQQTIANLKTEYQNTLTEYQNLVAKINSNSASYLDRINPSNPYLGKVIQLQGGALFYVTNQGVAKQIPNMDIYAEVSGKNGFPPQGEFTQVSIAWSDGYQSSGATIPTTPPLITGTPVKAGQSVGSEGQNVFVNKMINNPTATYQGCYADNSTNPLMTLIDVSYNYQQCQQSAVTGGFKYFSLQDTDPTSSTGSCYVSNDGTKSTSLGNSYVTTSQVSLWSSNTSGQNGNSAIFQNGSISVNNASDTSIFTTPNNSVPPNSYIGCYKDKSNRAMTPYNKGKRPYTNATCQQAAESIDAAYYGLQSSNTGQNAQCFTSNNLAQSKKYGTAKNCTRISDGTWSGGDWSNAIYSTNTPETTYFLILQDDGNMCIYLGSSPSDNQGIIWSSETTGQLQQSNPNMVATKNKFAQNWMPEGSILYPGEFLSSTNGNLALVMQTDGNLVLYTYTSTLNCSKMSDGNTGGGVGANAIYNLSAVGFKQFLSSLGFIDDDSKIHTYPSTNVTFSNTYTQFSGNSSGNDIEGASYGNSTIDQCKQTCNANSSCAGIVFDNNNNICYPKTSAMYPTGSLTNDNQNTTFVRGKMPINPPIGVSKSSNNIDTITYNNYVNGGPIQSNYGLNNATSAQKQQLEQLQTKLNLLSSQITSFTNKFSSGTSTSLSQSNKNINGIQDYLKDIIKTNKKISSFDNNVENVLNDSDITVLKHNYDYLFWSILATGTVLLSMNLFKKQQ